MGFSRFAWLLFARLAGLFSLLAVLAYVLVATDFVAVAAVLVAVIVLFAWQIIHFVDRTNTELARFLDAVRYDDFSQSFAIGDLGATFADLRHAFEEVMNRFRDARSAREAQGRYLEALVEHVPVAIIAVGDDDQVELLNNAARRLLDAGRAMPLEALEGYGAQFYEDVAGARPGERKLTRLEMDGVDRQLIINTTQIASGGEVERLISLQDIQRELDATELSAWQDMVRIISHEIMNSITPIASLARTADEMLGELGAGAHHDSGGDDAGGPTGGDDELLADIRDAVDTVARRSAGLMRFVESYRQLTRLPPPRRQPLALDEYVRRLETLLRAEWDGRDVELVIAAPASGLAISADEQLLDQAIINLVRNAAEAATDAGVDAPTVWLEARLSDRGRPVIEVSDNGAGLDAELAEKIFLPFFTTKPSGSGIGLSLVRQVMLLHDGAVTARPRDGGGAIFQLRF